MTSCDSNLKMLENPIESKNPTNLLNCPDDEIESLFVDNDGILYAGDDHGGVTVFEKGKLKFKMNMVESVHGLIVEDNWVYTIRNLDLMIQEFNKSEF